jgi:protein-L-isoaspartate(D-aspartate) O-methyltransferase
VENDPYLDKRKQMVAWQIERRGVFDPRVLSAMQSIPRHLFVPLENREEAYEDYPLPIGYSQTISQPYIVGLMTSLLQLQGVEKVLEIGTGSGYQAAVLAQVARQIISIEYVPQLAVRAQKTLRELGIHNVEILCQDGSGGYPDGAPYQGILVTACAPQLPQPLLDQLELNSRLVIPVGEYSNQILQIWEKDKAGNISSRDHIPVSFVPLRGKWGKKYTAYDQQ